MLASLALLVALAAPPQDAAQAPAAQPPATPPAAPPPPTDLGKVIRSDGGTVVIDAGREQGVKSGDRVELLVDRGVDLGLGEVVSRLEKVATGEVTAVGPSRSQVQLDLDQSAPVGAVARFTKEAAPSIAQAPRPAPSWHLRLAIRPFIALGDTGFGDLSEVTVGRRFEAPVHVQLVIEPLGIAVKRSGQAAFGVFAGSAIVSWDTRNFEVGLGFGVSTINNATSSGADEDTRSFGPGIAQLVRLGAIDGVNVVARGLIVLDDSDEFAFSTFRADLQAPVGGASWLVLSGGGGIAQYALAEAGVRVLVSGNGTAGSLFLTPVLGVAGVQADRGGSRVEATGLSVGIAAEWRL